MNLSLRGNQVAYLRGKSATLALAKTLGRLFYLETDKEEVILFTEDEDLIVASAFSTGEKVEMGLKCTLYQIREMEAPIIVLPKGHPASPRLKTVISRQELTLSKMSFAAL